MKKLVCLLVFALVFANFGVYSEEAVQFTVEIEVGDYFNFGTYNGSTILWRCVDIDENGVLLLSDKIICEKAFDGKGTVTTGSHGRTANNRRTTSGSGYWGDSNIRCWLNSDAPTGEVVWTCGNSPSSSNVNGNAYDNEAGFLNAFTDGEKSLIKEVTLKSLLYKTEYSDMSLYGEAAHIYKTSLNSTASTFVLQNYDTAYSENLTEKVFLLDVKQMVNLYDYFSEYFPDENYHIAKRANGTAVESWLRTPAATLTYGVYTRTIQTSGSVGNQQGNLGSIGVRPAFYIKDTAVIDSGDGSATSPFTVIAPQNNGDIQISATLPAHNGTTSGWVITTTRNTSGEIINIYMNNITLSQTETTPVTITIPNADWTSGNYFDIYVWDTDLKPVIDVARYNFQVIDGSPTAILLD